jgi:hypothetical protein
MSNVEGNSVRLGIFSLNCVIVLLNTTVVELSPVGYGGKIKCPSIPILEGMYRQSYHFFKKGREKTIFDNEWARKFGYIPLFEHY